MALPRDTGPSGAAGRSSARGAPAPAGAYADLADAEVVALVVAGDAAALEALYARHGRVAYSLARRLLGDDGLAQDVVQEVFLTVWRDATRYDAGRGAFSTWLLTMTHHKAVDSVRREENLRKRRTTVDVLEDRETDGPRVEDEVWVALRRDRVRAALQLLPPPQKEALGLAYYGGYTQREIAGLTATPLGTVKTRMLAGMRTLRRSLEGGATQDIPDTREEDDR